MSKSLTYLASLITFLILSVMFAFAINTYAKDINLAWEPSPSDGVTGYKIHFVCGEMTYDTDGVLVPFPGIVDVGNVLEATLTGFTDSDDCWFSSTAYDGIDESVYSNIVLSPGYVKPTPPGQLRGNTKIRGKQIDLK